MSKAEDKAKELYPDWKMTGVSNVDGQEESMVRIQRVAYIKGYRQAEKDLELTWEDIKTIDKLLNQCVDYSNPYQEVLKRFNEQRNDRH